MKRGGTTTNPPRRSRTRPRVRRTSGPREGSLLASRVLDLLEEAHPEAACALRYANAYELLVATILSAQCTDKRVNEVTPALFARYPRPGELAVASAPELEELIRPTGFFRAKARSLIGCARGLVARHGGEVPRSLAELVELPGVGRKTANVVLGHAYDLNEGVAVDTHVQRVAGRLGLVRSREPLKIEAELMRSIPRERWTRTTDLLIFHGRKVCAARRPACGSCTLFAVCRFPGRQAAALDTGPQPRRARPSGGRPQAGSR